MEKARYSVFKILVFLLLVFSFVEVSCYNVSKAGEDSFDNDIGVNFSSKELKSYNGENMEFDYTITKRAENGKAGEVKLKCFYSPEENLDIKIPEYVIWTDCKYKVTCIGPLAFINSSINTVSIPKYVKEICKEAFINSEIKKIYIPKNVKKIGTGVLSYCRKLESIEVDPNNKYYCSFDGMLTTKNKKTLIATVLVNDYFVVPKPVQKIEDYALSNLVYISPRTGRIGAIKKITFASSVRYIGLRNLNAYVYIFKGPAPKINCTAEDYQLAKVYDKYLEDYRNLTYDGESVFSSTWQNQKVLSTIEYYDANMKFIKGLVPKDHIKKQSSAVVKKAKEITKGLKTDSEKAFAICNWVNDNIELDDLTEICNTSFYASTKYVLEHKKAGANGMTNLINSLLNAIGIPSLTITSNSGYNYTTLVYNLAYIDGNWIIIDVYHILGSDIEEYYGRSFYIYSQYWPMNFYTFLK